jgi:hypothetical protein
MGPPTILLGTRVATRAPHPSVTARVAHGTGQIRYGPYRVEPCSKLGPYTTRLPYTAVTVNTASLYGCPRARRQHVWSGTGRGHELTYLKNITNSQGQ